MRVKIRKLIRDARLQWQVTAIIFLIVFAMVLFNAAYSGQSFADSMYAGTEQYSMQLLNQAKQNIGTYITDMENVAAIANSQSDILELLFNDAPIENNYSSYYQSIMEVRNFLQSLSAIRKDIVCITITGANNNITTSSAQSTGIDSYGFKDQDWYDIAYETGESLFVAPHTVSYIPNVTRPVISLVQTISMYKGGEALGLIVIDLNTQVLSSICSKITLGKTGYVYIVDKAGNYIYHPDQKYTFHQYSAENMLDDDVYMQRVLSGETSFTAGNSDSKDMIVLSTPLDQTNWTMVGVVSRAEVFADSAKLQTMQTIVGVIVALLIAITLAMALRLLVFKRLNVLQKNMLSAQSKGLDVVYKDSRSDEIGELGKSFNYMIERIRQLMSSVVKTEAEKRKAELAVLQSQINPHFLYNTLDTIVWMAEYNKSGAAEMADLLAKFFRLALSKGDDAVTLAQEILHVESYLRIQKIRYQTRFDYKIELDEEIKDIIVPKLIVQPLVENAIYHGIKMSRKKCKLLIRAFPDGGDIAIQIIDDGIGMDQATIQNIFSGKNVSSKPLGGVGITNVNERIKLYYSQEYGISYYSVKGAGTVAEIRLGTIIPTKQ